MTATRAAVAPKEGMAPLVVSLKQLTQSCASIVSHDGAWRVEYSALLVGEITAPNAHIK